VQASCRCLVGHVRTGIRISILPHNFAKLQYYISMSMQMDTEFKEEKYGNPFVWVGALEGGFWGWVVPQGCPQKYVPVQKQKTPPRMKQKKREVTRRTLLRPRIVQLLHRTDSIQLEFLFRHTKAIKANHNVWRVCSNRTGIHKGCNSSQMWWAESLSTFLTT
jgi:hypothetical protein